MYDSSSNHVAFTQGDIALTEQGGMVGIPVIVTAGLDDPAITVDFIVDAEQSVAVSGVDFTIDNDPLSLNYPNGWGYDTIYSVIKSQATFISSIAVSNSLISSVNSDSSAK